MRHSTLTGEFDTRSAIHWIKETLDSNQISGLRQRASEWNAGNSIATSLADRWFQAEAGQSSPASLAVDYLSAKESMVNAVFAVQ